MEVDRDISLSLLVIDLQTSCVVKAERGTCSFTVCFGSNNAEIEKVLIDTEWRTRLVTRPFSDVRAALDALEDKPVPRIPIYEGKQGKWTELANGTYLGGVKIWRYER